MYACHCTLTILSLLLISPSLVASDVRRIDMTFEGQMISAIAELKEKIADDPDLSGRSIRLGKFSGPHLPDSTFDAAFEQKFMQLMTPALAEQSEFVVNGMYDLIEGTLSENEGIDVIQFSIEIRYRRRKMASVTREINNSADITRINGGTVALPNDRTPGEKPDHYFKRRNKAASETADVDGSAEDDFRIHNATQIMAPGCPDYAVEILSIGSGSQPTAVVPRSVNGRSFVDIGVGQKLVVKVYNYNRKFEANAKIAIDGLDVANTFCSDKQQYAGYVIPKATATTPGKHLVPGWLVTTKRKQNNVYQFVVNKLGQGAATEMKSRHRLGVIHVEFFAAVPENGSLPRGHGEIGRGQTMDVNYKTKAFKFRDSPLANISIRYSNR